MSLGFCSAVDNPTSELLLEAVALCNSTYPNYPGHRYAPEMELVKHAIDFSQRDVEGAVECDLYKVRQAPWGRIRPLQIVLLRSPLVSHMRWFLPCSL